MSKRFFEFCTDEDGAVTVDWVVLTAGIVLMVALLLQIWSDGTIGAASTAAANMQTVN